MIVRAATPDDYPALADLWFDSWISIGISNETDLSRDDVRESFFAEAAIKWRLSAAKREGPLAGILALVPEECRIDRISLRRKGRAAVSAAC